MTTKQMDTIDQLHDATRSRTQAENQHRAVDMTDWTPQQVEDAHYLDQLDDAQPIPLTLTTLADEQVGTFAMDVAQTPDLADLPLEALEALADCAMQDAGVLVDNLATLRRRAPSRPETYAYDLHQRRAYLDAEAKAQEAWQALAHALQLIKGLAR
jgi:hypothetical protein